MKATISRIRRNDEGFTLIEMMIVIVVLGILAGIVIFALGTFQDDATTATEDANCRQIATAEAAAAASGKSVGSYFDSGSPPATTLGQCD